MRRLRVTLSLVALAACLCGVPAWADDSRDLCADRPGLGTPACTVSPGHVVAEIGLADWTHDADSTSRTDTVTAGEMLLRAGVTDSLEAQVGWTAYGHVRMRDKLTGAVDKVARVGDMTFALRQNLHNPDGSGFSVALMPYVTLPVGRAPVGAGDWSAGVIAPLSFQLNDTVSLAFTPEIDAAADSDGNGRHLRFGSVVGLGFALTDNLSASTEVALYRDRDPDGHATEALLGLSAAWQANDATQFDAGLNLGLNSQSPDSELYIGIVRRF